MKKIFKNRLFIFLLGGIVFSGITVYATEIFASSIKYKDTNVESAIDELYTISSTYKNLSSSTTVDSSNLLSGVTAYNSNGQLITGNLSANCISGYVHHSPNTQIDINLGFTPSSFFGSYYWQEKNMSLYLVYNSSVNNNIYLAYSDTDDNKIHIENYNGFVAFENNHFISRYGVGRNLALDYNFYYIACS